MGHEHSHHTQRNLGLTVALNLVITIAQFVGGFISGSLALISDAIHNLSDVIAVLLAFVAHRIGLRPRTTQSTFGFKRAEILAAFINSLVLIGISVFMVFEAVERFLNPTEVDFRWMLALGGVGFVVNSLSVLVLHADKKENINIKAAYLHLMGDALTSVAVIAGALAIWLFKLTWIDPLVTILISAYIFAHTCSVLKESVEILMQFAPDDLDAAGLVDCLMRVDKVAGIHHIHLWQLVDHRIYFEAHVQLVANLTVRETAAISRQIEILLHEKYHITHVTLQFEYGTCDDQEC